MINGIGVSSGSLVGTTGQTVTQRGDGAGKTGGTASREDSAQVSTTFSRIAAAGAPVDTDRIAALRAAIKSGGYRPDSQAIAGRMIDTDLGATS